MDSQDDAMDTGVDVVIEMVEASGPIDVAEGTAGSDPMEETEAGTPNETSVPSDRVESREAGDPGRAAESPREGMSAS